MSVAASMSVSRVVTRALVDAITLVLASTLADMVAIEASMFSSKLL